jgi:Tol biopolymer transport system component
MFTRRPYRYSFRALTIIVLISATWLFVNAQTKAPLTHETMWMMKRVGAPVPSPDGKWVVFSLVEPAYDEKDQVSDLWIVPTDGNVKPRRLTSTKGGESGVSWSPDSRQIAFCSATRWR